MPGAGRAKNWTAGSCNVPTWPGLLATSRAPNLATHRARAHPFVAKHIPDTSQASKNQYLPEHGHVHDTSEHKTTGSSTQVHVRMQLSAVARGEGSVVGPARLSSRRRATKKVRVDLPTPRQSRYVARRRHSHSGKVESSSCVLSR